LKKRAWTISKEMGLHVMFSQQSMYQLYFEALATKEILERFALEKESLDKKQRNEIQGDVFLTI
jgi:hypothetical protein